MLIIKNIKDTIHNFFAQKLNLALCVLEQSRPSNILIAFYIQESFSASDFRSQLKEK